jgi:hypothetical protein
MLGVTFYFDEFAVFDVGQHPTAAMAARSGRPGGRPHDFGF